MHTIGRAFIACTYMARTERRLYELLHLNCIKLLRLFGADKLQKVNYKKHTHSPTNRHHIFENTTTGMLTSPPPRDLWLNDLYMTYVVSICAHVCTCIEAICQTSEYFAFRGRSIPGGGGGGVKMDCEGH